MRSRLVRWGNGYGLRLRKRDLETIGAREGSIVEFTPRVVKQPDRVDLSDRPTYRDPDPRASLKVDEFLYGED